MTKEPGIERRGNSFAFYGRVSTEDQQDPAASKAWQLSRASALIEPHGGRIVREFFDVGQSRSLPWKRRPESSALLATFTDQARGFEAVVIGEPHRAFYGGQFGDTFPLFDRYGVELWVPELGGKVDGDSDVQRLMMQLYGGLSEVERRRIRIRVRSGMATLATAGRFLGGRPPYGYLLVATDPHPTPAKAAMGARLHRLEADPATAPVVERIFEEYVGGSGLYAIAEGLTRDGIPSPSANDPARNRHRQGSGGAWSKSAIRAIVANPRYTGSQVWNRQRREEVLLNVHNTSEGYRSRLRWNDPDAWVWSSAPTHDAIIDRDLFERAQEIRRAGVRRPGTRARATRRPYLLRGLLVCGVCGRRMQGNPNHGETYYRCRYPSEYAVTANVAHPKTVYVREAAIVPEVDRLLVELASPANIDKSAGELVKASRDGDGGASARIEAARRKVEDCEKRIERLVKAIEDGGESEPIRNRISALVAERSAAEAELRGMPATEPPLTKAEARELLQGLRKAVQRLATADPGLRAELYAELGLRLEYDPAERVVRIEVPCALERVGGGI